MLFRLPILTRLRIILWRLFTRIWSTHSRLNRIAIMAWEWAWVWEAVINGII